MGSKNKKGETGERIFGGGKKVITDERFASAQKDRGFQDVPKRKNKVAIDSRFSRMFTDKNFSTSSSSVRVDKRGRAKHYYRIDQQEEEEEEKQPDEEESSDDEKFSESESLEESEEEELMDDFTSTDTDGDDQVYLEEEIADAFAGGGGGCTFN